ncbi:pre-mRNA-splicing factor ATP-dependent RNA helicase PRP43 [Aureobasidium pullulans]|nr:pre-mRNA-splicing factor ATP-dependent RNA helicase PRP43 [Aureobasidium pullulans]
MSQSINPHTGKPFSASYEAIRRQARALPVAQHMPRLLSAIRNNPVTIIVGETGSGKSTQVPKHVVDDLSDMLNGKVVCLTQPRRLAAQSVAERIAIEMDVPMGSAVGLKYRGHDTTGPHTRLEVNTDGTAVAMAKVDKMMSRFGVVIIDEAHQHSVPTDLLLGLLKDLLRRRKDLKVVIMSATIDTDLFRNYFPQSVVETVSGRQYPVTVNFLREPSRNLIADIIEMVFFIHHTSIVGDILVFVSGVREITKIITGIEKGLLGERFQGMLPLECLPLHSKLPVEDQDLAVHSLAPMGRSALGRKVIVSTNIAETSITIERTTHVVDSCKAKSNIWDPTTESRSLREQPVSKADFLQRKGRAGRTQEGMAWPMCTERGFHEDLVDNAIPPIAQADMMSETLSLLALGKSPVNFDFIVPPASETIVTALEDLYQLGALELNAKLSPRGTQLARIPIDVQSALTILVAPKFGCADEIITIFAMIEASVGGSHLFKPARGKEQNERLADIKRSFQHASGDHITLFHIYLSWREACKNKTESEWLYNNMLLGEVLRNVDRTRKQLRSIMYKVPGWEMCDMRMDHPGYYSTILQALAAGNFLRIAKRDPHSGAYQVVRSGMNVALSKYTAVRPGSKLSQWVMYHECYDDPEKGKAIRLVSAIAPEVMVSSEEEYWWDVENFPEGHIRDGVLKALAVVSGHQQFRPAGMPALVDAQAL